MDTTKLLEELYGEPVKWDIAYAGCEKVANRIILLWLGEVDEQKRIATYIEFFKTWGEAEKLYTLTKEKVFSIFAETAGDYALKTFSGRMWSNLLIILPQCAENCDWAKLMDQDWNNLLSYQPQFINKCNYLEKLNGHTWSIILQHYPELAGKCNKWSEFETSDWTKLLQVQPQFAGRFSQWNQLGQDEWLDLLEKQPQFADKYNGWDKCTSWNWARLLAEQPRFVVKCNQWEKFTAHDWATLLSRQPQFRDKCNSEDWSYWPLKELTLTKPFVNKCDLEHLSADDWLILLENSPEYQSKCYCNHWGEKPLKILLEKFPEFNLNRLDSYSWASLCRMFPEFADRCKWKTFTGHDWSYLLQKQPQFADRCKWETFTGHDWSYLLQKQPQFADKCNWAKLNRKDWFALVEQQPQFGEQSSLFYSLTHKEWIDILCSYPKLDCWFSKVMNQKFQENSLFHVEIDCWTTLSGDEWCQLLIEQPYLFRYCKWDKLGSDNWKELLEQHPVFICKYKSIPPIEILTSMLMENAVVVLFIDYELSKRKLNYTKGEWLELLAWYLPFPSLIAKQCPWEEFTAEDWESLLESHPQYADWYDITTQKANE